MEHGSTKKSVGATNQNCCFDRARRIGAAAADWCGSGRLVRQRRIGAAVAAAERITIPGTGGDRRNRDLPIGNLLCPCDGLHVYASHGFVSWLHTFSICA